MRGSWRWTVGSGIVASLVCSAALSAQAPASPGGGGPWSDVCSLATSAEFQKAQEVNPKIKIPPSEPEATEMVWGPHCDYPGGSIDLFTKKTPSAELDRVLALTKARKERAAVPGLGQRAFFTTVYPDDQYRRRGFLAVFVGSRVVTFSMDPYGDESLEGTRPRLEGLAKLVLPRLK